MEAWPRLEAKKQANWLFLEPKIPCREGGTLVQVALVLVQCYNYVSGYCKSSDGSSYLRGALFPQILFIFATFLKIRISEYCLKSNIFLHQMASQPASSSSSGRLYMDLKTIAKEYAKTWLPGQHRNTETGVFRA